MIRLYRSQAQAFAEDGNFCCFGLIEAPLAAAIAGGLTDVGVTAGLAGPIAGGLATGAIGAAGGAALSGITGGNPLTGALTGGLTGGAVGALGPAIGSAVGGATGLSPGVATGVGDVLAGTAAGAAGSALTGGSPLTGALEGGAVGGVMGLGGSGTSGPATASGTAAVSPSAGGIASAGGAGGPGAVSLPSGGNPAVDLSSADFTGTLPGSTVGVAPGATFGSSGNFVPGPGGSSTGNFTPGTASAGGAGGIANNMLGFFENNPGMLLGAGALGLDMMMGNQPLPAESQVQNNAASEGSVGKTLSSYIFSGTLPSGMQDIVDANTNSAIAAVKGNYAKMGLSGSTMEQQAVNQVHQAAAAQVSQIAEQLLQQGQGFSALSNQEFNTLLQAQMQQDAALQQALGSFAGGLAGLRSPSTSSG